MNVSLHHFLPSEATSWLLFAVLDLRLICLPLRDPHTSCQRISPRAQTSPRVTMIKCVLSKLGRFAFQKLFTRAHAAALDSRILKVDFLTRIMHTCRFIYDLLCVIIKVVSI
jgi:hypothetical protein